MTYKATKSGEWPMGVFWTEGECREVEGEAPAWLVPVVESTPPVAPVEPAVGEEGE